jgi:septum site-determining protein MinC
MTHPVGAMTATKTQQAFEFKGSMVTIPVLYLKNTCMAMFAKQLSDTVSQSPNFFQGSPMLIDLEKLPEDVAIDFVALCHALRTHHIVPIGIRHGSKPQLEAAKQAGLGCLAASKTNKKEKKPTNNDVAPMIINKPVRSGQQLYAKNTDLIIFGSVSSAAEVLADGNIIVYGTLQGKAMAGVSGKQTARILCSALHANLVAIAGHYKLRDELEDGIVPQSKFGTQVFLDKQHLCIQKI